MTTREDLLKLAEEWKKANPKSKKPLYIIYTLDYPYSQVTYYVPWLGRDITYPSPGIVEDHSFSILTDDLDKAIHYLNENGNGVEDGCFRGAFILIQIPDIMPFNTTETRMFFRWDEKKKAFFRKKNRKRSMGYPLSRAAL